MTTSLIEIGSRESKAKALTKLSVEATKPRETRFEIPDSKVTGLRLITQPSGKKSWAVRYTVAGRDRRLTLGDYPTLGLDEARKRASAAKRSVTLGEDPAAAKKEARQIEAARAASKNSVQYFWGEYQDDHLSLLRSSTATNAAHFFENWTLPKLGKIEIGNVTKEDVLSVLNEVLKAGYPSAANRGRAVLKAFFNWVISEKKAISLSPCAGVKRPAPKTKRKRRLSDNELRWLWAACNEEPYPFGPMIQLLILTGARRNEISGLSHAELNSRESRWTLPSVRSKNKQEHQTHLSQNALRIIATLPRVKNRTGLLFCTNGETAVSGFSRAKARIDGRMLAIAQREAIASGADPSSLNIQNWSLHDLRRTLASGMQRLGIQLEVIEKCLNHVSGSQDGIVGDYQQYEFEEEAKDALEKWSAHVEGLVALKAVASNVTALKPRHLTKRAADSPRRRA